MNQRSLGRAFVAAVFLCLGFGSFASTPTRPAKRVSTQKEAAMTTTHARGTFEVKLTPQDDKTGEPTLGRMTIDKQIHGDLEGTSKGQMLTAGPDANGSGVYVAIEKVSGTLDGRKGTFLLHHTGVMTRGAPQLTITVVPDSGTGELKGITGKMTIEIVDRKHEYTLEYRLQDGP
jgi:hypothetical protein